MGHKIFLLAKTKNQYLRTIKKCAISKYKDFIVFLWIYEINSLSKRKQTDEKSFK